MSRDQKQLSGPRPDGDIVRAVVAGETEAFGELVERYAGMVQAVAYQRTFDHAAADDVAQQALLASYSSIAELREPAKFASWLYSIAKRTAIAWVREKGREPGREAVEALADAAAPGGDAETVDRVRAGLAALDEDAREILVLRYFRGAKVREVAGFLGINVGNAKVRLLRAREALRKQLGDLYDER